MWRKVLRHYRKRVSLGFGMLGTGHKSLSPNQISHNLEAFWDKSRCFDFEAFSQVFIFKGPMLEELTKAIKGNPYP